MINDKFTNVIAHLKEWTMYVLKLKMLLIFGLLTIVLISGITIVLAETLPQQQKISSYSKSTVVVNFDPNKGQAPEGLAVSNKDVFVAWSPIGQVAKINKDNLTVSKYGSWPTIPPNKGSMLGLNFDKQENLYAAVSSLSPELKSGVYRLSPGGAGHATLFATHPNMTFPNDLLFDKQGRLFVSDSASGSLFTVQPNGKVAKWLSDPLLKGDRKFCPPAKLPLDIGANGIAFDKNDTSLFVANTDRASIIRVPIMKNGSAGKPELFVGPDCKNLNGADGIILDKDGSIIVAVNKLNKIVRVSMDKKITVLESGGGILDFPASVKIDNGTVGRQKQQQQRILYITDLGSIPSGKHLTPRVALLKAGLGS